MRTINSLIVASGTAALFAVGLCGCEGSTTSGGLEDFRDTTFVADSSNTGSMSLNLSSSDVEVAGSTGFFVNVVSANGEGVAGIQVLCDTEAGLAIIDPVSGKFITSASGSVSGSIGCQSPGSFTMGCRLANGLNLREFAQVKCIGDVPDGFEGFPGAGGGTLGQGGGVLSPDAGGPGAVGDGLGGLRITKIEVNNVFGELDSVPEIDTSASFCDAGTPLDNSDDFVETWGDDEVYITISNDTDRQVEFTGIEYIVKGGRSDGSDARSPFIRTVGSIDPRSEGVVLAATIFDAATGPVKTYADAATPIPLDLGPRNVRFTVFGITNLGEAVQFSAATNFNFDQYNNCGR